MSITRTDSTVGAAAGQTLNLLDKVTDFVNLLDAARATGRTVGLVPTMGALHAGHRALIERAADENDVVAVTIFVNPLQFGDQEDLARYPRTLPTDLALCAETGATVVLAPTVAEMYPSWPGPATTVVSVGGLPAAPSAGGLSNRWEGASRPGHFDGVATVVTKLFAMAGRCRAYFGEKDFQQLALVTRLAADLSLPVTVVGCPIVRDADGLALSSRNTRLSPSERRAALVLPAALRAGACAVVDGVRDPAAVSAVMTAVVETEPAVTLDYAAAVDPCDLTELPVLDRPVRLLIAAQVGPVRLIDNCAAAPPILPAQPQRPV